jgi:hypothetical protein
MVGTLHPMLVLAGSNWIAIATGVASFLGMYTEAMRERRERTNPRYYWLGGAVPAIYDMPVPTPEEGRQARIVATKVALWCAEGHDRQSAPAHAWVQVGPVLVGDCPHCHRVFFRSDDDD